VNSNKHTLDTNIARSGQVEKAGDATILIFICT